MLIRRDSGRAKPCPFRASAIRYGMTDGTRRLIGALGAIFLAPRLCADPGWWESQDLIAHAMGAVGGCSYSNSLEAFEHNYRRGYRLFEVDLELTSDGVAVLRHNWSDFCDTPEFSIEAPPSLERYKKSKIYKLFTPLSIDDLVDLMARYEDAYVVVDKLYANTRTYVNQIVSKAEGRGVIDRFVIQVFDIPSYELIDGIHHFKHYLFTLYRHGQVRLDEVADFCVERGIPAIAFPKEWASNGAAAIFKKRGLKVYAHTVNKSAEADSLMRLGVDGFFSDYLDPAEY